MGYKSFFGRGSVLDPLGGAYGAPTTLYSDGIPLHDLVHNASPDF